MNNQLYNMGFRKIKLGDVYVYSYTFPILKNKTLLGDIIIKEDNTIIVDVYDRSTHERYYPYYYDWNNAHSVVNKKINKYIKPIYNKVEKIIKGDTKDDDTGIC